MNWSIDFFLQNSLVTIIAMACIHVFLYANKNISKYVRNMFLTLTTLLMMEGLEAYVDHVLSLMNDNSLGTLRVAVSAFGYTVRPSMLYLVILIMLREFKHKWKYIVFAIPAIITAVISMMAFWTKLVFYYDEANQFHGGPLRYVLFAVLIIYFTMILVINVIRCRSNKAESIILFAVMGFLTLDWILALVYDIISLHSEFEAMSFLLYFMYFVSDYHAEKIEEKNQEIIESEERLTKSMLDQAIETLAYTIDAKDKYTKGHSSRVAKYSRMIAGMAGKSEEECRQIYLAGLLHDIGKISISDAIINKQGKLTDEEYAKIKSHPEKGALILDKMKNIPFLQNGAKYHHERYDGKGYPQGLRGTEIPDMARIIAVADAYDAMTSYRSYRQTMEQNFVKQELWKGIGTQFDPWYAKMMISLIDADPKYEMREFPNKQDEIIFDGYAEEIVWPSSPSVNTEGEETAPSEAAEGMNSLAAYIRIEEKWGAILKGHRVVSEPGNIRVMSKTRPDAKFLWCTPLVLVYSSDDGEVLGPNYMEFGVFMSAGYGWQAGPALAEQSFFFKEKDFTDWDEWIAKNKEGISYRVHYHMEDNAVILSIENGLLTMSATLVVPPEFKKKMSIAVTGLECDVTEE